MSKSLVDRILADIEVGVEETKADMGEDAPSEIDITWAIMESMLAGHSLAIHNAVRRRLGFDTLT